MKLDIIYQDDQIVVVNKPADLLTIPDRHDPSKPSLYGALNKHFGKVFIVHRLDRETSGILVFALNEVAHRELSMQFESKETRKIYLALLDGAMHAEEGEINKPIAEHSSVGGRMVVASRGKESLTLYRVVERFKHFTLVEADIRTGRTHQIRVHFQSISYPLAVDTLYGRRDKLLASDIKKAKFHVGKFTEEVQPLMGRTSLHAFRLKLRHPVSNEIMSFETELPKDFKAVLNQLRKWGKP
jgi:23S rRNA pseudouridine1911/1915/1917 synthase